MAVLSFDVFWKDRGAEKGLGNLGDKSETAHKKMSGLRELGPQIGAAFAGLEVADFLHDSITAASDLNETVSKTQAIFGSSAPVVQQWAQGAARNMGLSSQAALEAASSFGDMFRQLGFNSQQSVDLSENTVQLAADLGSFNNLNTDDVLERISAAYRGEYDSLQQLIPNISAARVEHEAMALTGKKSTSALTEQDKALAVNAILHKDGARAIGDFARTSGGAANQQRILAAEFENTKAAVGQALLPVMTQFLGILQNVGVPALNAFATVIQSIPTPVYGLAAALVGIYGTMKLVNTATEVYGEFSKAASGALQLLGLRSGQAAVAEGTEAVAANTAATATGRLGAAATAAGTAVGTMAGKLALIGGVTALAAVSAQLTGYMGKADVATVSTDDLAKSLLELQTTGKASGAAIDLASVSSARLRGSVDDANDVVKRFGDEAKGAFGDGLGDIIGRFQTGNERIERFNATAAQLDQALAKMVSSGHGAEAAALIDRIRVASGLSDGEFQHVTNHLPQYAAAVASAGQANAGAAPKVRSLADEQRAATAAAEKAKAAYEREITALEKATQTFFDTRAAARDARAAHDDLTKSLHDNKRGLDINTAAGRANQAALDADAQATLKALQAKRDAGTPMRVYTQLVRTSEAALIRDAQAAGMSRQAAQQYARTVLAVPRRQVTQYLTPGLAAARAGARGLQTDISRINGRVITVRYQADGKVLITAGGTTRTARAMGGPIPGWSPNATADNVPVAATAGEHMWSVAEVKGAGGHAGVARLRAAARAGALALAAGGPVVSTRYAGSFGSGHIMSDFIDRWAGGWASSSGGGGQSVGLGGSGVRRWLPTVLAALRIMGQPSSLSGITLRRMNQESGGNPTIVNRWDSNWLAGTPSVGLMQVIGPTYARYKHGGYNRGPFLYGVSVDPMSNILASMNYAIAQYGGLARAYGRAGGYDRGGLARGAGALWKGPAPERVLSPAQTAVFERAMTRVGRGAVDGGVTINLTLDPSALAFQDRVVDAMRAAARAGRVSRAAVLA